MRYLSTRAKNNKMVTAAEAIKLGLAPDGGLFVPAHFVKVSPERLQEMVGYNYAQLAQQILADYLTDYTADEINHCVTSAYNTTKFDHVDIAPVHSLNSNLHVLELWHGPTCAFKDMALQILPHFLTLAAQKTGEKDEIVILVATSGDTGKAALEGFKDVPGTKIIVFFPDQGVSEVQRMQMLTQQGSNVNVVAVQGNFDHCQSGVKQVFADKQFNQQLATKGYKLSSANSINWGRLVPQVVYYFAAYVNLVQSGQLDMGEPVNFVVPTGNFGNILAGFYAQQMGLPVNRFICAANANNVLSDFINTGRYDCNREFLKTISPSMDILISSNLERLLFELTGRDSDQVNQWMHQLITTGTYTVGKDLLDKVQQFFWSGYASDRETLSTIKEVWVNYHYLMDTHTAVAYKVYHDYQKQTGDTTKAIIASTASPFKFNASVARAVLGGDAIVGQDEFELLHMLSQYTDWAVPQGLRNLNQRPVLHNKKTARDGIEAAVKNILKL